jgi:hypothetical protein
MNELKMVDFFEQKKSALFSQNGFLYQSKIFILKSEIYR